MGSAGRVLVVEDDTAVAEAITAALAHDYQVQCVLTGSETIAAICENSFDLLLLDHRLSDLLGTDLLKLIKRFFPATTFVFMTGQGSEEVAIDALRGGARDYLRKPFKLQKLATSVDSVFAVRRSGRECRRDAHAQHLDEPSPLGRPAIDTDNSRSILRVVHHIESHLDAPLTLGGVAQLAGMSRFHFCRQFRRATGHSFHAFLLRTRIGRAKELLRDDTRPIGDVAVEVGFRDASHFGRVFRRIEHIRPSEFRRRTVPALRER
jgi:AraC family transcriptional regulator